MDHRYSEALWIIPRIVMVITSAALWVGCSVGPDYEPPLEQTPEGWHAELSEGLIGTPADPKLLAHWWQSFNDPLLTSLVERAVKGNLDLKEAGARVREARARRGLSNADRFPTLTASGAATKTRSSAATGGSSETNFYAAGFDTSWELDLFGGVQRSVEAADADLEAAREDLYDVLVSLTSEVALNYIEVRSYQTRLAIAKANQKAQEETYQRVVNRHKAGLTNPLDVEQARYNLENTRSDIPNLHSGLAEAKNRLAVLLGLKPGILEDELREEKAIPVPPLEVAIGMPAEALRRRPDVRRSEQELVSQTARIGVATADLYPKFTLVGSIGLEALSSHSLFQSGSRTTGIGPSVSWNIFDAGRVRQNIEVETAKQEQALIRYESAILNALEEVENALVAYADEQVRRDALLVASQASERAVNLAQNQYQAGLTDFQNVLEAERSLLSFQDQLAVSEQRITANLIRLYKALGGGWTPLDTSKQN